MKTSQLAGHCRIGVRWVLMMCVVVLSAMATLAQDTQFRFDLSGNLASQGGASAGLPVIVAPPQPQLVQPGELASFSVVVADPRNLAYQWLFNGTNLIGATADALLLTNVTTANQGQYTVIVSNAFGSVTSAPAALMIDADADELADSWELAFFGSLSQFPYADSDGDGVSNADEFHDGTNPTNKTSALYAVTISSDGGMLTFSPSKPKYTNGEVVTITAAPLGSELFHGWTGDAVTTNTEVVLMMTTNRFLTAHFSYYTIVWTNTAGGDWQSATNWSPNLVPAKGDTVVLNNNATLTVSGSVECGTLLLGASGVSPSVTGSGTLTVHTNGAWTSGKMSGGGRTIINSNAIFTINNANTVFLDTRTLDNAGTIVWTGADGVNLQASAAVITNRAGALFEIRNNASFSPFPASSRFDNAGTLRKTTGSGITSFAVNNSFGTAFPFNNYGATEIQSGTLLCSAACLNSAAFTLAPATTLRLTAGGSGGGMFDTPAGAVVEWTGGTFTLAPGGLLVGNGLYRIGGGTVTMNADVAVYNLDLLATVDGSGRLTISNMLNWTAGTMGGSGRTIIAEGATTSINNVSTVFLNARTLENAGTIVWTGADGANLQASGAVITNRAGALFEIRNNASFSPFPASSRFDNAGTLRKTTGSGITSFAVNNSFGTAFPFNNYGATEIQSGTLLCSAACLNSGAFTLAPATTLRLASGGSGSGMFDTPAGAVVEWTGGTFTLAPGGLLVGNGLYRIGGGTVTMNADVAVYNLDLLATLDGSGRLTISNMLNWTAGTMGGSGRTIIAEGATTSINNVNTVFLNARTLENAGTIVWTGADGANLQASGAVITNRPGALFDVRNNGSFFPFPASSRFDNAGTLRKTAGSGTTSFAVNNSFATAFPFNNYGATDIQAGTLLCSAACFNNGAVTLSPGTTFRLAGGGSGTGTFNNPAGAMVDWTSGTFLLAPGALLGGNGLYRVGGGTLTVNADLAVYNLDLLATLDGSGRLTVSNVLNWSAGTMGASGRTIIAPGATNYISNASTIFLNARTFENAGTIIWTGADSASLQASGGVITNRAGALFEVRNNAPFFPFPASSRFDNAGTLRKSLGSGTTTFAVHNSFGTFFPFNNYGTVDIRNGTVAATGGYTCTSDSLLHCFIGGTNAGVSYGRLQANGAVMLNGALRVSLTNGFVPSVNDTFTVFSASSRNGSFSSFAYPSNVVAMQLSNTTASVVLRVTDITLTNGAPVIISDLPVSQLFYDGRTMTLPARVAGGQPFTFQWQKDGADLTNGARIAGANDATLIVTNALRAFDAGQYRLFITNSEGSATSRVSIVSIQAAPKFNANGAGWSLQGTTLPPMNTNNTTLTAGLGSTARSVFYNAPLYIREFLAQFVYVDVGGGGADGVTFCIHNHPGAPKVVGGGGGGLGYAGITPSAALALNIYQPNTRGMSWRTNGTLPAPTPYNPIGPVNLASGNPVFVSLLYTGGVLRATFVESNTPNTFATNLQVNIPAMVGGDTGFVGFTGGDGGLASTQVISNFVFAPLARVAFEQSPETFAMAWPAPIGGYTVQVRSNLNAGSLWQNTTNFVNQVSNQNRVVLPPSDASGFYQLNVNLTE